MSVIPTTIQSSNNEQNAILGYTVRILGNAIKLAQLEIQTMMLLDPFPPISNATAMATLRNDSDPSKSKKCQYEPVFMQLADENK